MKKGEDTCITDEKMEVNEAHPTGQRKSQRVHSQPNQDNTGIYKVTTLYKIYTSVNVPEIVCWVIGQCARKAYMHNL